MNRTKWDVAKEVDDLRVQGAVPKLRSAVAVYVPMVMILDRVFVHCGSEAQLKELVLL
jgi:hypothetical protein